MLGDLVRHKDEHKVIRIEFRVSTFRWKLVLLLDNGAGWAGPIRGQHDAFGSSTRTQQRSH